MTRKDYVALAEDIKNTMNYFDGVQEPKRVLQILVSNFMEYLKEDNANFNSVKFAEACGFEVI